jgi:hypothetical protein
LQDSLTYSSDLSQFHKFFFGLAIFSGRTNPHMFKF